MHPCGQGVSKGQAPRDGRPVSPAGIALCQLTHLPCAGENIFFSGTTLPSNSTCKLFLRQTKHNHSQAQQLEILIVPHRCMEFGIQKQYRKKQPPGFWSGSILLSLSDYFLSTYPVPISGLYKCLCHKQRSYLRSTCFLWNLASFWVGWSAVFGLSKPWLVFRHLLFLSHSFTHSQPNPLNIDSEVNPIIVNGTYSQVRMELQSLTH